MKLPNTYKQIKTYAWLFYPFFVVGIIIFTWQFVAGGPDQPWFRLLQTNQRVQEQRLLAGHLETKVKQLQSVNLAEANKSLAELATAMPTSKQIDIVVAQLRQASQESGASLTSYSAQVGDVQDDQMEFVLTANLTVADIAGLERFLASLENKLPLLTITDIDYNAPQVVLAVQQAWAPLAKLSPAIEEPLPSYIDEMQITRAKLGNFVAVGVSAPVVASDSAQIPAIDPFTPGN